MTYKSPTLQTKRRPFAEFLEHVEFGRLSQEATDALNDLTHAVTETGKSGSITLTIKLKPVGTTGQIEIDADVKAKQPTPVRGKTLMFATPDNNLQREDPRQQTLDGLKTAAQEAQSQALRVVG